MTFNQMLSAIALGAIVFLSSIAGAGPADADPSKGASNSVSRTPSNSTRAVGATGYFRFQVVLQCSQGKCSGNGPTVSADDRYNVIHNVSCFVSVGNNGQLIDIWADVEGYVLDLGLQWERKLDTTTRYNFGKQTDLWIDTGKRAKVSGTYTPAHAVVRNAYCLFTGEFTE
jgi:hypothetical protein